jgi:hypothetical protein
MSIRSFSAASIPALLGIPAILGGLAAAFAAGAEPPPPVARPLPTAGEARERAQILHEAMHATLQIVHHEYYREDEGLTIPAATLQGVFREMATRQGVELRWLAVQGEAMNSDQAAQRLRAPCRGGAGGREGRI